MRFRLKGSATYAEWLIDAEALSDRSQKDPKDAIDHFVDTLLTPSISFKTRSTDKV